MNPNKWMPEREPEFFKISDKSIKTYKPMRKLTTIEILAIITVTEILISGKLHGGAILFVCYGIYKIGKMTFDYIVNDEL